MNQSPQTIADTTYLSPLEAEVLFHYDNGLSHAEIGDRIGIAKTTVSARLNRRIPSKYQKALEDIERTEATLALLDENEQPYIKKPWTNDVDELVDSTFLSLVEASVYLLICADRSNDEIAEELDMGKSTVESFRYAKIPNKFEMVLSDRISRIEATLTLLDEVMDMDEKFLDEPIHEPESPTV